MGSSLFDLIVHASSISVGELQARAPNDVSSVASELVALNQQGLVTFVSTGSQAPILPESASEAEVALKSIISDEAQANSVFVTPTALGFKSMG